MNETTPDPRLADDPDGHPPTRDAFEQSSVTDILDAIEWDDVVENRIITIDEIEEQLRAKGLDPNEFDYLYD